MRDMEIRLGFGVDWKPCREFSQETVSSLRQQAEPLLRGVAEAGGAELEVLPPSRAGAPPLSGNKITWACATLSQEPGR